MPETKAGAKDFKDLVKELRPIEDPSLTAEEAWNQQIKKPKIPKTVIKNYIGYQATTTAATPEPDFEEVDLKKLKNRQVTPES